jgi:hypothetical protein
LEAYELGFLGCRVLGALSSDSDTSSDSSGSDSDCVFLYATSGAYHKGEVVMKSVVIRLPRLFLQKRYYF